MGWLGDGSWKAVELPLSTPNDFTNPPSSDILGHCCNLKQKPLLLSSIRTNMNTGHMVTVIMWGVMYSTTDLKVGGHHLTISSFHLLLLLLLLLKMNWLKWRLTIKTVTGALYKVFRPNVQSQLLCTEQCNVLWGFPKVICMAYTLLKLSYIVFKYSSLCSLLSLLYTPHLSIGGTAAAAHQHSGLAPLPSTGDVP